MTVPKSHFKVRRCNCGQTPQIGSDRDEDTVTTFVFCPSCGVRGAEVKTCVLPDTQSSLAEADAVGCWNRDLTKSPKEVESRHG